MTVYHCRFNSAFYLRNYKKTSYDNIRTNKALNPLFSEPTVLCTDRKNGIKFPHVKITLKRPGERHLVYEEYLVRRSRYS
jgi:hypothetical protein